MFRQTTSSRCGDVSIYDPVIRDGFKLGLPMGPQR